MAKIFPTGFTTRGTVIAADKLLISNNTDVCHFTTVEELLDVLSDITIDAPTFTGVTTVESLNINGTALAASADELNTLDGITALVAELNFCDGVTSPIQTQLNAKASAASVAGLATEAAVALKADAENPVFTGRISFGSFSAIASALIDFDSTSMAVLFPRMTTAQRNAITPVAGMVVYVTDAAGGNGQFSGYTSSGWHWFTMYG